MSDGTTLNYWECALERSGCQLLDMPCIVNCECKNNTSYILCIWCGCSKSQVFVLCVLSCCNRVCFTQVFVYGSTLFIRRLGGTALRINVMRRLFGSNAYHAPSTLPVACIADRDPATTTRAPSTTYREVLLSDMIRICCLHHPVHPHNPRSINR